MKPGDITTENCAKHGEYKAEWYRSIASIFSGSMDMIHSACPKCYEDYEAEEERKTQQARDSAFLASMKAMNIEPMYFDATLDNFTPFSPEQERAKLAISDMIETKAGKIIFLGNHGTGKTHLSICALKAIGGKILTMYEITTAIRATYTPTAKETELDAVDNLAHLPMLVIDEIGRTKGSDAETNWLSYILDKRHTRGLPVILISNKHTRKMCEKPEGCPNCLENFISEDIMSRLNEDGKLIYFAGDDYRKVKRAQSRQS